MCPNCNAPIRGDSEFCTNCGTRVRPVSGPQGPVRPNQALATPQFRFDRKRLTTPDLVIGGASVVTFLSMFLPWFGVLGYSTSGISLHGYLVIVLLTSLALLGYLALRAGWDTPPVRLPIAHAPLLLIGTAIQFLIVFIAFLQSDGLSHDFGSYLGLLAALVACAAIAVPVIRSVLDAQRGGTG